MSRSNCSVACCVSVVGRRALTAVVSSMLRAGVPMARVENAEGRIEF